MTGGRMRRVDEAMREVLSAAITSEKRAPGSLLIWVYSRSRALCAARWAIR